MFKFCGPKCSLCCALTSVWGIVQLTLMGIFFWIRSPAFLEDLVIPEHAHDSAEGYLTAMDDSFHTIAINCGVAAALYGVTLVVSGWQMWLNNRN
ncbi:hypothetical protein Pmani_016271 [Petrolisthes manimaculis]|uniref:Uncharacterized protein n=1 Tax=Petrolisthes manimaculis TaxID=1843537 RepID=A0AAE1UAQ8_9EUCA|nr:hypothetical protein Pmani_016271 [Petrolisthes manimaculis]